MNPVKAHVLCTQDDNIIGARTTELDFETFDYQLAKFKIDK